MQRWRGMPAGGGQEALADIVVFWIFAPLSLAFACFLTTAGDYNRWRVHLDVSLQLISSFFQFFTPAPWPPFRTPLRTPLTVGTFSQTKPLKYFREIASSLWRCRIVHSTLHCRTEGSCILEPNKFQKFRRWRNLKNFKEVTTTFTSWQLLTIIVNCCILDLNSTNPNEEETQRSSKNKQQHSQVEIFTLRWDVMKTAKSRDCYATVCWFFSKCSRECCLDIFVEVAPVTSPCFLRFLQPLMTWSGGKNQFPQSYGTFTGCPICDFLLRALCL